VVSAYWFLFIHSNLELDLIKGMAIGQSPLPVLRD
jgi:hypothetical protein